jgi:hypothetical protein
MKSIEPNETSKDLTQKTFFFDDSIDKDFSKKGVTSLQVSRKNIWTINKQIEMQSKNETSNQTDFFNREPQYLYFPLRADVQSIIKRKI